MKKPKPSRLIDPKLLVRRAIIALSTRDIMPVKNNGRLQYKTLEKPGGYWVYIQYHPTNNCVLWKDFTYNLISQTLPKSRRFIPEMCQNCYKVVVRPSKYVDFLQLYGIMKEKLLYPSKIGIEMREAVDALYGAYWYCTGREEGLERLDQVKNEVFPLDAFLKRGCTEYEREFGPSDKWEVKSWQIHIEEEVDSQIYIDNFKNPQPEDDIKKILTTWAQFAERVGPDYEPSHNYVTYEA